MKKNLEDKLAMLAFEDITPEEAKALELEAANDPEARVALFEYREMREGLRAMADIPEHQLSTERLRDAILAQGLKPQSTSSSKISWLWMPAAACALAFSFIAVKNMRSGEAVRQMGGNGSVAVSEKKDSIFVEPDAAVAVGVKSHDVAEVFDGASVQPSVTMTAFHSEAPRHSGGSSRREARIAALTAAVEAQFDQDINSIDSPMKGSSSRESAPVPTMAFANPSSPNADAMMMSSRSSEKKIVVIDGTKDAVTGAQRATEVDSSSNVLVGG